METTVREQIKQHVNQALNQSHGATFTYDDLFKYIFSDYGDDRCSDTHSMEDFENQLDILLNNGKIIIIYIQVDDAAIFKAEATGIDAYDPDDDETGILSNYSFLISQSQIYIMID